MPPVSPSPDTMLTLIQSALSEGPMQQCLKQLVLNLEQSVQLSADDAQWDEVPSEPEVGACCYASALLSHMRPVSCLLLIQMLLA